MQKTGENAVQGWTTPDGTIVLNTDGVSPDNANAVFLHEAFHSGARKLIGTASWNKLLEELGQIHRQYERSTGKARSYFDKARARVENAERATGDMPAALRAEEFGAYAIEEYETAPRSLRMWADDFWAM
ncbi:hypothetical protein HED48_23380 [Ochrobactrum intermedium]|nr:hypothetical protein [Brucella intermedia]